MMFFYFFLVYLKIGMLMYVIFLVIMGSCIFVFFSSLDVLSSVLLFSMFFIFMFMVVVLFVSRYYVKDVILKRDIMKFVILLFVIFGLLIGIMIFWSFKYRGWIGYVVMVGLWFLGILGMVLISK